MITGDDSYGWRDVGDKDGDADARKEDDSDGDDEMDDGGNLGILTEMGIFASLSHL